MQGLKRLYKRGAMEAFAPLLQFPRSNNFTQFVIFEVGNSEILWFFRRNLYPLDLNPYTGADIDQAKMIDSFYQHVF